MPWIGLGHHIARSTTIGVPLVEVMVADTGGGARRGSSPFTAMVSRLSGGHLVHLVDTSSRPAADSVMRDRRRAWQTDCRSG